VGSYRIQLRCFPPRQRGLAQPAVLIATIDVTTFLVFFTAAVAIFMVQMLRSIALSLASVADVSTLQRSSAVFMMLLILG
jgi:hypothetical protein